MKRYYKGFTLVELVITIAVVIVLSSISVQIYQDYIGKSKIAEAYLLLSQVRKAQETYYSEYGHFIRAYDSYGHNGYTDNDNLLGINARTNKYFKQFSYSSVSGGTGDLLYLIKIKVYNPLSIYSNKYHMCLLYNITSGTTFFEE